MKYDRSTLDENIELELDLEYIFLSGICQNAKLVILFTSRLQTHQGHLTVKINKVHNIHNFANRPRLAQLLFFM